MLTLRRVLIGDYERVLLIRKRSVVEILDSGDLWIFGRNIELLTYNLGDSVFTGEWANYIVTCRPEVAARYFAVIETLESQVANWKGVVNVTFELIERAWHTWAASPWQPSPLPTRASAGSCIPTVGCSGNWSPGPTDSGTRLRRPAPKCSKTGASPWK